MYTSTCLECGQVFRSRQYNADFCRTECRRKFNNRRARRGAVLYDLLMIEAAEPERFKEVRLDGLASAVVEKFRQEDEAANRKRSHKRIADVVQDTLIYRTSNRPRQ